MAAPTRIIAPPTLYDRTDDQITLDEAEKIELRPGHRTPRAHLFTGATFVAVRELGFETQTLLRAAPTPPEPHVLVTQTYGRWVATALLLTASVLAGP